MTIWDGCEGVTLRRQLVRAGRRVRRVLRIEQYKVSDHGAAGIRETRGAGLSLRELAEWQGQGKQTLRIG